MFSSNNNISSFLQGILDYVMEKARKVGEQQTLLTKTTSDCSKEIGFALDNAVRLLYGDFSLNDEKSKVNSAKMETEIIDLNIFLVFCEMLFHKERLHKPKRRSSERSHDQFFI